MKVGSKFKFSSWILSTVKVRQKVLCPWGGPSETKNSTHIYIVVEIDVMDEIDLQLFQCL